MQVVRVRKRTDHSGIVHVDAETDVRDAQVEIVMVITPAAEPTLPRYDFSDLVGKLEWRGDAVAEQRRLRDEWS